MKRPIIISSPLLIKRRMDLKPDQKKNIYREWKKPEVIIACVGLLINALVSWYTISLFYQTAESVKIAKDANNLADRIFRYSKLKDVKNEKDQVAKENKEYEHREKILEISLQNAISAKLSSEFLNRRNVDQQKQFDQEFDVVLQAGAFFFDVDLAKNEIGTIQFIDNKGRQYGEIINETYQMIIINRDFDRKKSLDSLEKSKYYVKQSRIVFSNGFNAEFYFVFPGQFVRRLFIEDLNFLVKGVINYNVNGRRKKYTYIVHLQNTQPPEFILNVNEEIKKSKGNDSKGAFDK